MKFVKLSNMDMPVSRIALGTWQFSGDAWGPLEENTCIQTMHAALDGGINLVDTAPVYGFGRAEEVVGKALKGIRNRVVLATKCGLLNEGKSIRTHLKPDSIRKELDLSLQRLQTDYIDLYQTHWPEGQPSGLPDGAGENGLWGWCFRLRCSSSISTGEVDHWLLARVANQNRNRGKLFASCWTLERGNTFHNDSLLPDASTTSTTGN